MIIITIRDDLGSSLEMRLDNKHTGGVRHRPANTFENTFGFRGGSSARASRVCPGSPRCLFTGGVSRLSLFTRVDRVVLVE
jgi:hypothetical protein